LKNKIKNKDHRYKKNRFLDLMRHAVFGIEDGLVSTLGIVFGTSVGSHNPKIVILAGFAGLISGGLSMGAGTYLSSKSQRELYEKKFLEEKVHAKHEIKKELDDLNKIYKEKGIDGKFIKSFLKCISRNPKLLARIVSMEKIGIVPEAFDRPLLNASLITGLFLLVGLIPILPFFFYKIAVAQQVSIVATVSALFLFGGFRSKFSQRGFLKSGLEMVAIALLAAILGYGVGRVLGI